MGCGDDATEQNMIWTRAYRLRAKTQVTFRPGRGQGVASWRHVASLTFTLYGIEL